MESDYSSDPFGLLGAIITRLHRDLDGPRDGGRDGWELCCKALLWFMLSKGFFSFPRTKRVHSLNNYLFKKVVNTARKFSLDEDEVCLGLYALKKVAERKRNEI